MENNVSYRKGCKVAAVFLRINCVVYAVVAPFILIAAMSTGFYELILTAVGSVVFSFLYGWMASSVKAMVKDTEADTMDIADTTDNADSEGQ